MSVRVGGDWAGGGPGQGLGLHESLRDEHDLTDQPKVGDAHGAGTEQHLGLEQEEEQPWTTP